MIAQRHAPSHRYWTVVGNGLNRIAANEVRIKLSELCYKSISSDIAEDKKHIDLCTEPLILVCAVGLQGSNADDTAKEVAYHRAHRAAPIVITTAGEDRFSSALETIYLPPVDPALGFVLSTMAGHLFGYEAALAIDASARPLREARAAIQAVVAAGEAAHHDGDLLTHLAPELTRVARVFIDGLRTGSYDGDLEAGTAVQLASLLRYAIGSAPLDLYEIDHGKVGTPSTVVEDLTAALTQAINELTRTIDTIKHQAKTVTVGISRSDEELLRVELVKLVLAAGRGARCAQLPVAAHTRRARSRGRRGPTGSPATASKATSPPTPRRCTSSTPPSSSRRARSPIRCSAARSTASRPSARSRIARGRNDGRTVLLVPEVKGNEVVGLTLLHVDARRPSPGRRRPGGAPGLPGPVQRAEGRGHRDHARLRRRTCSRPSTSWTCSPSPSTCSPTSWHAEPSRSGTEPVPVQARSRHDPRAGDRPRGGRAVPARAASGGPRWPSGSSPMASGSTAHSQHDPAESLAARFAAKEAVMKALGVGLGDFEFRDVEVRRADSGEPSLVLTGKAARDRRRTRRRVVAALALAHRHHRDGGRHRARRVAGPWSRFSRPTRWRAPISARSRQEPRWRRSWSEPGRRSRGTCAPRSAVATGSAAVVVCGKGNNGGDGLVVGARARALGRARAGVRARTTASTERELARALDERRTSWSTRCSAPGLQRALDGDAAMVVDQLRDWDGLTVAVDIPSGIDGLTGAVRGAAVHADRTVTFAARKPGLLFEPGRSHAGEVHRRRHRDRPRARRRRARPARLLRRVRRRAVPPAARAGRAQVVERGDGGRGLAGDDRRADVHESRRRCAPGAGMVWCSIPGDSVSGTGSRPCRTEGPCRTGTGSVPDGERERGRRADAAGRARRPRAGSVRSRSGPGSAPATEVGRPRA